MAKKLIINCTTCDARNIQEDHYTHFEHILINSDLLLTNPQARAVMNKLPITLNCDNSLDMEGNVQLRTFNGNAEIKGEDLVPSYRYYMEVNGTLTIGSNTQKQLAQCVGISVNGTLIYPESIAPVLPNVQVNGSTLCHPDGAILLKGNAVIDRLFALRAKKSLYWSRRRIILVDPQLDAQMLRAKGATFSSQEAIIAQSKVEELIDLIDEKTEIIIVPDGTSVVLDDVTLDSEALHRYGTKLYVVGDVTVPESGDGLEQMTYLNVRGDVKVPQARRDLLLKIAAEITGQLKVQLPKGLTLSDKPFVKITKRMLEQQPLGVQVEDCAVVDIAQDIPQELILQRLQITDCAVVKCTEELLDALTVVCTDVAQIGPSSAGSAGVGGLGGIGGIIQGAMKGIQGLLDVQLINADEYVL